LKGLGVDKKQFQRTKEKLSERSKKEVGPKVVVWKILETLLKNETELFGITQIYGFMADLYADDDEDPTEFLIKIAKLYKSYDVIGYDDERPYFLRKSLLAYADRLIRKGKYPEAENLLLKSFPDINVLTLYRKLCGKKAKAAKRDGDWGLVIKHLEDYLIYANQFKHQWLEQGDREPPGLTEEQNKLLEEAKVQVDNNNK